MTRYILLFVSVISLLACHKRQDEFSFAGVWEIEKVEIVQYKSGVKASDTVITNEPGWFAFQNANGWNGAGKIQIDYPTLTGLSTKYTSEWSIDEHGGDRVEINGVTLTRKKVNNSEEWSYMIVNNSGVNYTRETIFVKHQ